jgi:glyoxylase-like metal-dependent hydrolase (beta-lactamase superfamily II)
MRCPFISGRGLGTEILAFFKLGCRISLNREERILTPKNHQPIQITPHLYQLGIPNFPAYLSLGEKAMLIEGGTGATSDIILKQIETLGIDPATISCLVLPHTHPDHVGAFPRFRALWPWMKIIAGEIGAKFLAKETFFKAFVPTDKHITDLLIQRSDISQPPSDMERFNFSVDETVREGDTIDLGKGVEWQVYVSPGHCPDHIALIEKKENTLAIGDTCGYHDPQRDIFWPNYFAGLETYCNSIRKLAALPAKRLLLGHNGVIEGDTAAHFHKAIKATEAFHQELLARVNAGEDKKEVAKEKAAWVFEFAPLAPLGGISFLNTQLINISLEERDKDLFFLP